MIEEAVAEYEDKLGIRSKFIQGETIHGVSLN